MVDSFRIHNEKQLNAYLNARVTYPDPVKITGLYTGLGSFYITKSLEPAVNKKSDALATMMFLLRVSNRHSGYYSMCVKEHIQNILPGFKETILKLYNNKDIINPNPMQAASAISNIFLDDNLKELVKKDLSRILKIRTKQFYQLIQKVLLFFPYDFVKEVLVETFKNNPRKINPNFLIGTKSYVLPSELENILLENNAQIIRQLVWKPVEIRRLYALDYCFSDITKQIAVDEYLKYVVKYMEKTDINSIDNCFTIMTQSLIEIVEHPHLLNRELIIPALDYQYSNDFLMQQIKVFKIHFDINCHEIDVTTISKDDIKALLSTNTDAISIVTNKVQKLLNNNIGQLDREGVLL